VVPQVGADLSLGDARYGQTPLHFAASKDQGRCAQQLLDLGADPLCTDGAGWTPLHTAARAGSADVARVLLAALPAGGADTIGPDAQTALHRAAFWGHTELCALLIEGGAARKQADSRGRLPADVACDGGDRRGELPQLIKLLRAPQPNYVSSS
jgi:ankyrin